MTIDDRLTRAGAQFRDTHTERADVRLDAPAAARPRPRPRPPRRRLVAVGSTVLALAAVTAGVLVWLGTSRPTPQRTPAGPTSGAATAAADPAADLARGPWRLVTVDDGGTDVALPTAPGYPPDLRFDLGEGRVTASDGCNDFSARVTIGAEQLTFGEGSITAVGCPDDGATFRLVIGRVFFGGTVTWALTGDSLTVSRDGTTLTYARAAPDPDALTAGAWTLISATTGGEYASLPTESDRPLQLTFDPAGRVIVGDGCNTLGADVEVAATTLTFGPVGGTDVLCTDDLELGRQVRQVFTSGTATWSIDRDQLTVQRDATILTYARV